MKVLVTGASGFIGKEIVSECLNSGFEVIQIISHRSEKNISELNKFRISGETVAVDITNRTNVRNLEKLQNIDVVLHAAGLAHQFGDTKKEEFDLVNVQGTRNISELAVTLKVKQVILISTTAVYGTAEESIDDNQREKQSIFNENSETNPQTLYAKSKLEAERISTEICAQNQIPLTIFRLAPVIGEENVGNVARLIKAIDRRRFVWIGSGENYKSLIYKNDVARACVKLCKEKSGGLEIFNLAGEPIRMQDFVREITDGLQKGVLPFKIPAIFTKFIFGVNEKILRIKKIYKVQQTIEKWLAVEIYPNGKIKDKYNFAPKFTIAEGVRRQVGSYILKKKRKS